MLRRRSEEESAKAQVLLDRFVAQAKQTGLPTEELTARPRSGSGRYRTGGIGYGDVKALLAEQLHSTLTPVRDRYQALLADAARLDAALQAGERRANQRAAKTLRLMSAAMGL